MNAETVVVLASFMLLLVAAAAIFLFRTLMLRPGWTDVRRAVFDSIAEFLRNVSATLLGIAIVGYILDQVEGQQFDFANQGYKLLLAALTLLLAAIFIAGSAANRNDNL